MEARYDAGLVQPLPADAAEGGRRRDRRRRPRTSASRTSPGVVDRAATGSAVYPYAPLASHVLGYMGAITGDDEEHYEALATTRRSTASRSGAAGVELSMEEALHGKWGEVGLRGRRHQPHRPRRSATRRRSTAMDVQLSIDLDLQQYAERLLQTQLAPEARSSRRQPGGHASPTARARADGPGPGRRHAGALQGAGRLDDRDGPPRPGRSLAMASYPTFDNRWFAAGVDSDEVRPDLPDHGPRRRRRSTPTSRRSTNRAIQGQYNMGSTFKLFTAYAALATGRLGAGDDLQRPGHVHAGTSIDQDDVCAERRPLRVPQLDVPARRQAVPVRRRST